MIEQLAGLAYVALFVSRVVGLTLNRRRMTHPEAGEQPGPPAGQTAAGSRDRPATGPMTVTAGARTPAASPERRDVGHGPAHGALTGQPRLHHRQRGGVGGQALGDELGGDRGQRRDPHQHDERRAAAGQRAPVERGAGVGRAAGGPETTVKPWVSVRWVSGTPGERRARRARTTPRG